MLVLAREPASFWRENAIAVDSTKSSSENVNLNVTSSIILRSKAFFLQNNRAKFSGKGKYNEAFRVSIVLEYVKKL